MAFISVKSNTLKRCEILLRKKGDLYMVQVEVAITFEGRNYLTNVITDINTPDEEILRLAFEQVQKQWKK